MRKKFATPSKSKTKVSLLVVSFDAINLKPQILFASCLILFLSFQVVSVN